MAAAILDVDPVAAVARALVQQAQDAGIKEIALGQNLIAPGDDGDYRLDVAIALSPDGLLPLIIPRAERTYITARLNSTRQFPMEIEADADALLGQKVVWKKGPPVAHLGVALGCVLDALHQVITESPARDGVLTMSAIE